MNDLFPEPSNDELFEQFWKVYPNKQDKPDCRAYFKKMKPTQELVNLMIENIETRLECGAWDKKNGNKTYIIYPIRYLKREKWEDDIIPKYEKPEDKGRASQPFKAEKEKVKTGEEEEQSAMTGREALNDCWDNLGLKTKKK